VASKAVSATLLATGRTLTVRQECNGRLIVGGLPRRPPHPYVNVIRVRFDEPPRRLEEADRSAWLTGQAAAGD
jgi:hypothetical protein